MAWAWGEGGLGEWCPHTPPCVFSILEDIFIISFPYIILFFVTIWSNILLIIGKILPLNYIFVFGMVFA